MAGTSGRRYVPTMDSNITRQKRRDAFMKLSLPGLAAWHLVIHCRSCPEERVLSIVGLIERHGMAHTLGWIVPRLRCSTPTCRQAPRSVMLYLSLERGAQSVVLVGSGAFWASRRPIQGEAERRDSRPVCFSAHGTPITGTG